MNEADVARVCRMFQNFWKISCIRGGKEFLTLLTLFSFTPLLLSSFFFCSLPGSISVSDS